MQLYWMNYELYYLIKENNVIPWVKILITINKSRLYIRIVIKYTYYE